MKTIFFLANLPAQNKTVLVRVDYNVPVKGKKIVDNYKIEASLPTIKFLLQKNCKIILMTHLGRPKGKRVDNLKTKILADELKRLLPKQKIIALDDCFGKKIEKKIKEGKNKDIFLLENLRFYKEEKQNDSVFAHALAGLANFYVNDAFGVSHRKHASVNAITKFLPSAAGLLLEKEIKQLSSALKPKKPFIWIIGGAKLDKVELIKNSLKKADRILVGGALAFSFLKAKGFQIGMSRVDTKSVKIAKKILKKPKKIILPIDLIVASDLNSKAKREVVSVNEIPVDKIGLDIGPKTVRLFANYLQKARTVVWNGPLGYFELKQFQKGTRAIAKLLSGLKADTIIGGGETSEAVHKFGLADKMSHVSTGGGASLEFLSGEKLPGIEALEKNYKKFRKKF